MTAATYSPSAGPKARNAWPSVAPISAPGQSAGRSSAGRSGSTVAASYSGRVAAANARSAPASPRDPGAGSRTRAAASAITVR